MDYKYEADNPDSLLKKRYIGLPTFFYGVPNVEERAEMIYRNLLKQYDGDLLRFQVNI